MLWCIHFWFPWFFIFPGFWVFPPRKTFLYYTGALCNPGLSTFSGFLIFEFPPLCKVLIPPNGFGFYSLLPSSHLLIPSTPVLKKSFCRTKSFAWIISQSIQSNKSSTSFPIYRVFFFLVCFHVCKTLFLLGLGFYWPCVDLDSIVCSGDDVLDFYLTSVSLL